MYTSENDADSMYTKKSLRFSMSSKTAIYKHIYIYIYIYLCTRTNHKMNTIFKKKNY